MVRKRKRHSRGRQLRLGETILDEEVDELLKLAGCAKEDTKAAMGLVQGIAWARSMIDTGPAPKMPPEVLKRIKAAANKLLAALEEFEKYDAAVYSFDSRRGSGLRNSKPSHFVRTIAEFAATRQDEIRRGPPEKFDKTTAVSFAAEYFRRYSEIVPSTNNHFGVFAQRFYQIALGSAAEKDASSLDWHVRQHFKQLKEIPPKEEQHAAEAAKRRKSNSRKMR